MLEVAAKKPGRELDYIESLDHFDEITDLYALRQLQNEEQRAGQDEPAGSGPSGGVVLEEYGE